MIKEILLKYIEYLTYKISLKYCVHDWELLEKYDVTSVINPNSTWDKWVYRCRKCCEHKVVGINQ